MKEKVTVERYLSLKSLQIAPLRANTKKYRSSFILSFAREQLTLCHDPSGKDSFFASPATRATTLSLVLFRGEKRVRIETRRDAQKALSLSFLYEDETASLSLEKHRYSRDDDVVAPIFILRLRRLPGAQQRVQTNVRFTHARHDVHIRGFKLDSAKLDANGSGVSFRQSNER